MKDSELAVLWRGYRRPTWFGRHTVWICGHCSAVVSDPQLHTNWHNNLRDLLHLVNNA